MTEFVVPTIGEQYRGITAGPDGNLWFTENQVGVIGRMNLSGVLSGEFSTSSPDSDPVAITAGPDGNLWFAEYYSSQSRIGRISPDGVISEYQVPTAHSDAEQLTVGPDHNIWFAEYAANKIGKLVIAQFGTPTVRVSDAGGTYNGSPFPATATVAGVIPGVDDTPASSLEGVPLTLDYVRLNPDGTQTDLGTDAPVGAGGYEVMASFAGSADYLPASASTTFVIERAAPTFGLLSSPAVVVGTASTTLSGQISLGELIPTGGVTITLNGVSQTAAIHGDGTFSASFATSLLSVGSYDISYSYGGDANFTGAAAAGTLQVTYATEALFDQARAVKSGSVLPVKVEITDANGMDDSSANIALTAGTIQGADGRTYTPRCVGKANPDELFRYDAALGGYIFNLDTSGLAAGTGCSNSCWGLPARCGILGS